MGIVTDAWAKMRSVAPSIRWGGSGIAGGAPNTQAGETVRDTELGRRPTAENSLIYQYRQMWVDPALRAAILDVREMDAADGRVKRIHSRIARDTVKGGLVFTQPSPRRELLKLWKEFAYRLQLHRVEKLKSDARGLAMEGNLPLQWVIDKDLNVTAAVRMPSESILPNVNEGGRFKDVAEAYWQVDVNTGAKLASFPLWQLLVCRFDPQSFDDMGAMGRPFLDSSREVWRKLRMTEEDLVIRRRHRAPLRLSHILEGASKDDLDIYRADVEKDKGEITTDFYSNKKGSVTAVQGDATLSDIGDVVHLLDTFFAGSPLPKGLMGYTDGLARDILEDLKRDYYEEIDTFQDTLAFAYSEGFRLQLLLKGIVPDPEEYTISFAERRTETGNQLADRMLKWKALGVPQDVVDEEMGFNAQVMQKRRDEAAKQNDPYPAGAGSIGGTGKVSITPGNAPKGESMTSISNGSTKPSSSP